MAAGESTASDSGTAPPDEVKPYRIHVSSRYLDLTRQKLEIARLPREPPEGGNQDWWQPRSEVEPLIDFWLEQYDWRQEESVLNEALPQFRTRFPVPLPLPHDPASPPLSSVPSEASVRIHFIHIHSPHSHAIPLLLIPPFPLSNLSFGHLTKGFTDPQDAAEEQPFHLVIPSLPGLGFSDALPQEAPPISSSASLFNSLMCRLGYPTYLVTNASSGSASPAGIDFQLVDYLVNIFPDTCIGAHLISPPVKAPKIKEAPMEWARWSIASLLRIPLMGYKTDDFSALERYRQSSSVEESKTVARSVLNQLELREPNTMSYALCDSPTGMLVYLLKMLRLLGPDWNFSPTELITLTELVWLPGPEAPMRLWAQCSLHPEKINRTRGTRRPRIGLTVFLSDGSKTADSSSAEEGTPARPVPSDAADPYSCPGWAKTRYKVVHTHRAPGRSGLLAWERPDIIFAGVRDLAKTLGRLDSRLRTNPVQPTINLEGVVTDGAEGSSEEPTSSTDPLQQQRLAPSTGHERGHPQREISDETMVESAEGASNTGKASATFSSSSSVVRDPLPDTAKDDFAGGREEQTPGTTKAGHDATTLPKPNGGPAGNLQV